METIGRKYGLQPDFIRGEFEHSLIIESNLADLRHILEPNLKVDVLCLAFIFARHSMEMQNISGFGIKDCLTEANLGWKCFGTYSKHRETYTVDDKHVRDFSG